MNKPIKKILLLGGAAAQLVAIQKAKELGYYTIICDYLPDNPGQHIADAFYPVSTTDKDAILDVAIKENIAGIVAYSSDPAAPTAAYVAENMNLKGNGYENVRNFCEKQRFRKFLAQNDFNVPQSIELNSYVNHEAIDIEYFRFPIIVKPTDSSGSKGITVLENKDGLAEALAYAKKYSRNNILIIEEFICRDHPHVIEAEIFALNGEVVSWGLINSIRDSESNPLLPSSYSFPLELPPVRKTLVKKEISRLIGTLGNASGAFNIELIIDKHDRLFFLDAGPRNGGNMLPEFISMVTGKDIVSATIKNAMGDIERHDVEFDGESGGHWGLGVLHATESGIFKGIEYTTLAQESLVREVIQKSPGDRVRPFERCDDLVGLDFFHFRTKEEMDQVMCHQNNTMKVVLE